MEEVGLAARVQGIYFVFRGYHQTMVRHHLDRHLRGPCWGMAGHTGHVVSTLPFHRREVILIYASWRLSGLREGRCTRGFLWNQIECCAGVERMWTPFTAFIYAT
jgi:hypothetical protein